MRLTGLFEGVAEDIEHWTRKAAQAEDAAERAKYERCVAALREEAQSYTDLGITENEEET